MKSIYIKLINLAVLGAFVLNTAIPVPLASAQNLTTSQLALPPVGTMVGISEGFVPPMLKGIILHPDKPFHFDFILDTGNSKFNNLELEQESQRMIKYFLAALTIPEDELWVNLSPNEPDRIIPNEFGKTEMGRDLLAEDYLLKQLSASLTMPETELGKEFWRKINDSLQSQVTSHKNDGDVVTGDPATLFNKIWIIPDEATIYENKDRAFVVKANLKVMLEEDYALSLRATAGSEAISDKGIASSPSVPRNDTTIQVLREVLIPAVEQEVNTGKNFARLRQIYHSYLLATWYKKKLKSGLLGNNPIGGYVDKGRTKGIEIEDQSQKEKIYQQYLEAFRKGVYDIIKEEYDPQTQEVIPRKYFSGGVKLNDSAQITSDMAMYTPIGELKSVATSFDAAQKADDGKDKEVLIEQLDRIFVDFKFSEPLVPRENYKERLLGILRHVLLSKNKDALMRVEKEILPQVAKINDLLATEAPTVDDWLAYSSMRLSSDYLKKVEALSELTDRPLASALLFAANGSHTRRVFWEEKREEESDDEVAHYTVDTDDWIAQVLLLKGFMPHLQKKLQLLKDMEQQKVKKSTARWKKEEAEVRMYAGGLFNGLLMGGKIKVGDRYVDSLLEFVTLQDATLGAQLRALIIECAPMFPEEMPAFMHFVGENMGSGEVNRAAEYNKRNKTRVNMRHIFLGVPSPEAAQYLKEQEERTRREHAKEVVGISVTQKQYKVLRSLDRAQVVDEQEADNAQGSQQTETIADLKQHIEEARNQYKDPEPKVRLNALRLITHDIFNDPINHVAELSALHNIVSRAPNLKGDALVQEFFKDVDQLVSKFRLYGFVTRLINAEQTNSLEGQLAVLRDVDAEIKDLFLSSGLLFKLTQQLQNQQLRDSLATVILDDGPDLGYERPYHTAYDAASGEVAKLENLFIEYGEQLTFLPSAKELNEPAKAKVMSARDSAVGDVIGAVNRVFYTLHPVNVFGFQTEENVTTNNAEASAKEFYSYLQQLKKQNKLPPKIVVQEWGVGRGDFLIQFLTYFLLQDPTREFIDHLEYQVYDISQNILDNVRQRVDDVAHHPRVEKYWSLASMQGKVTYNRIDVSKELPKSEVPPVFVRFEELYDDISGVEFVEKTTDGWQRVLIRPQLSADMVIETIDGQRVQPQEFIDDYLLSSDPDKVRQIKDADKILEQLAYVETLVPLDVSQLDYPAETQEFLDSLPAQVGTRFPLNIGAVKNLAQIPGLLSPEVGGVIQFFDYGFYRDLPQSNNVFSTYGKGYGGHLTVGVNFGYLEFMMKKLFRAPNVAVKNQLTWQKELLGPNIYAPEYDVDYPQLYQFKVTVDAAMASEDSKDFVMRLNEPEIRQLTVEEMQEAISAYYGKKKKAGRMATVPQYIGNGAENWVIGYGNSVLRILFKKGAWLDEKIHQEMGESNLSPKFLGKVKEIKIKGEVYDALEVERVWGYSLDKIEGELPADYLELFLNLLDKLIDERIHVKDFKPAQFMVGSIHRKNKVLPIQAYAVDLGHARREESSSIEFIISHYITSLQSAEYRLYWRTIDPSNKILAHLQARAVKAKGDSSSAMLAAANVAEGLKNEEFRQDLLLKSAKEWTPERLSLMNKAVKIVRSANKLNEDDLKISYDDKTGAYVVTKLSETTDAEITALVILTKNMDDSGYYEAAAVSSYEDAILLDVNSGELFEAMKEELQHFVDISQEENNLLLNELYGHARAGKTALDQACKRAVKELTKLEKRFIFGKGEGRIRIEELPREVRTILERISRSLSEQSYPVSAYLKEATDILVKKWKEARFNYQMQQIEQESGNNAMLSWNEARDLLSTWLLRGPVNNASYLMDIDKDVLSTLNELKKNTQLYWAIAVELLQELSLLKDKDPVTGSFDRARMLKEEVYSEQMFTLRLGFTKTAFENFLIIVEYRAKGISPRPKLEGVQYGAYIRQVVQNFLKYFSLGSSNTTLENFLLGIENSLDNVNLGPNGRKSLIVSLYLATRREHQFTDKMDGVKSLAAYIDEDGYVTLEQLKRDIHASSAQKISDEQINGLINKARELVGLTMSSEGAANAAMTSTPGGIDFNPKHLDMQTQGEEVDIPLPANNSLEVPVIDGLVPVIYSITPVTNIMLLLGANEAPSDEAFPQISLQN